MEYGSIPQHKENKTQDRYNIIYWSMFFIGMSIYFPWNILITVTSYWNYKLRDVRNDNMSLIYSGDDAADEDEETLTELQKIYNSYLAIASMVPNAIVMILHAFLGHKFSMKLRLYGSQVNQVYFGYYLNLVLFFFYK